MKTLIMSLAIVFGMALTTAYAVPFSLKNNTTKSIKLRIPGVMNPNLSPMSRSGVDLKVGQKVFFYHKGKKYLLLRVTRDLENKNLSVGKLIRKRKTELGLNKKG